MTSPAPFLRATVVGTTRSADLVLPADQPVAQLVHPLSDLLGEPPRSERIDIVMASGVVVEPTLTLRETAVQDGDVLRLVASTETPPTPVVHDMIELAERAAPPGRWSAASRAQVLALLGALLVVVGLMGVVGTQRGSAPARGWWAVAAVTVVLTVGARLWRAQAAAWALLGLGVVASTMAVRATPESSDTRILAGLAAAVTAIGVAGWCARRLAAAATTIGCGLLLATAWSLCSGTHLSTGRSAAVVGVVALALVGLLPRAALLTSGVLRLDAHAGAGRGVLRGDALAAVSQAHLALVGGTAVAAGAVGWATWSLARPALTPWPTALSICLSVAVALRGRHFPLAVERLVLWLAASAGAVAVALAAADAHPERRVLVLLLVVLTGAFLLTASRVPTADVTSAQLRRAAARVESAAVLLAIPLAVGVFDVYADLLTTFR